MAFVWFAVRWQIGAEFDVEVLAWTGPSTGKLMPPPEERNVSIMPVSWYAVDHVAITPHLGSVHALDRIILVNTSHCM